MVSRLPAIMVRLVTRVTRNPVSGRSRALAIGACSSLVALIFITDRAIVHVTFGAFYLVVVVVASTLLGTFAATLIAAACAAAWVLADEVIDTGASTLINLANAALRFLILMFVVVLLNALRSALKTSQASDRRSREFLGYAAHQLRTPVAGARAAAEALLSDGATPEQEPLLVEIAVETQRVGRLVSSLLRMARLEQGEEIRAHLFDVVPVCEQEAARAAARAPALTVTVHRAPGPPCRVVASPEGVREALANLLDNARRYAMTSIDVRIEESSAGVAISVVDDGPGVPAGAEERIFDRFVTMDEMGGTGLGLAIARALLVAQGGAIAYERGRFVISLPSSPRAVRSKVGRTRLPT